MNKKYNDRYEILNHLGSGSIGSVFHVKDAKTGEHFALKTLPASKINAVDLKSFQSEFDTLKKLDHPNICHVFDAGFNAIDESYYLVTELIRGKNLYEYAKNLHIDQIEELFVQALRAFNYLHQQSIVHLDVKPQNILVQNLHQHASLKVIDFGLANYYKRIKPQDKSDKKKQPIVGTAAYVAPEIIRGKPSDHRADLYSLGISFYKAFAGRPPFDTTSIGEAHSMHLNQIPQKPSLSNSQIPEYLDTIILKLLQKDPDARYQDASQVIKDLNYYANRSYSVETADTLVSYISESGELIGRSKELDKIKAYYHDRLMAKELKKPPYLIITGIKGTGKTRFLDEIIHQAKKNLVRTLSWDEFEKIPLHNLQTPCLVTGDDIIISIKYLQYLDIACGQLPLLVILGVPSDQLSEPINQENLIELQNLDLRETSDYLKKVTSISNIPEDITKKIYLRTKGNPELISRYTKALFQKGFFKDTQGTWSQAMLEDLGDELDEIGAGEVMFYESQGSDIADLARLFKLAKKQQENNLYQQAKKNYLTLLHGKNLSPDLYRESLLQMGSLCIETGKYDEAEKWLTQLVEICKSENGQADSSGSLFTLVKALEQLGLCYTRKKKFKKARPYFEEAFLQATKLTNDKWFPVTLKNRIARNEYDLGNNKKAEALFNESWETWNEELSGAEKAQVTRNDLDLILYERGEYKKAIQILEKQLDNLSDNKHSETYPFLLYRVAKCYIQDDKEEKAKDHLDQCLQLIKDRKTPHWLYNVYNELGVLELKRKNPKNALTNYQRAFELASRTSGGADIFTIAYNIATINYMLDNLEDAKKYFIYVVNNLRLTANLSTASQLHLYISLITLACIYRLQGNIIRAASFFTDAGSLLEKTPHLKNYSQYYWQEKAALHRIKQETRHEQDALAELEKLKNLPAFEKEEYDRWLKTLG